MTLDRVGLEHLASRYLDALVAHAPNRLPLAGNVRYTENGVELGLQDGLWGTAKRAGKYRILIPDVQSQQVAYMGVLEEAGHLICATTRLRVEDGYVTEIETLVNHPTLSGPGLFGAGAKMLEDMGAPHPEFTTKLKPAERLSRPKLIEIANSYFSGLERNTGRYPVPFDPDCNRRENGVQTTGNAAVTGVSSSAGSEPARPRDPNAGKSMFEMSPKEQLETGGLAFVTAIRNRRFPVVDEEVGNVLAFGFFDHSGQPETITWRDGRVTPSAIRMPVSFQITELFKIKGGLIRQIEANLTSTSYGMKCALWDE